MDGVPLRFGIFAAPVRWKIQRRVVPFDVLVTVDDMPGELLRHGRPTTVLRPSYEIGSMAANLLMDRVEGN
jgi:DNA-binding LacI/PurR family transcriptional regulator